MPYTDASGVQIPVGTDAFSPTTQFKTWQDKNATYNNRVPVALDSDRTSLAAPVLRAGLECYVESTKVLWLYDGGWNVIGGVVNQQLDTTNSTGFVVTQWGMGKVTGAATGSISETVTFPAAFAGVPFLGGSPYIGARTTAAWNPAGLIDINAPTTGKLISPSTTGLSVVMHRTDGANMSAGWDYYYSWSATGVLA